MQISKEISTENLSIKEKLCLLLYQNNDKSNEIYHFIQENKNLVSHQKIGDLSDDVRKNLAPPHMLKGKGSRKYINWLNGLNLFTFAFTCNCDMKVLTELKDLFNIDVNEETAPSYVLQALENVKSRLSLSLCGLLMERALVNFSDRDIYSIEFLNFLGKNNYDFENEKNHSFLFFCKNFDFKKELSSSGGSDPFTSKGGDLELIMNHINIFIEKKRLGITTQLSFSPQNSKSEKFKI